MLSGFVFRHAWQRRIFLLVYDKRMVTLGSEFDTHRMLVLMICINVLLIYHLLFVSGKLVASGAAQATA
jgi:hypothetical protein